MHTSVVLILTSCCILLRIVRELLRTSSNSCMHNIIVFILCIVLLASIVLLLELLSSMHTVYNMDSTSVVYCSSGIHNRDPKYYDTPINHVRAYAYELVVCIWHIDIMYVYSTTRITKKSCAVVSSSVNRAVRRLGSDAGSIHIETTSKTRRSCLLVALIERQIISS